MVRVCSWLQAALPDRSLQRSVPRPGGTKLISSGSIAAMRIWVDCDSGIDDAQALLALAAAEREGTVSVQGVSCVAGNVSQSQGLVNLQRVACALQRGDWPLFRGAERPLDGRDRPRSTYFGEDGLGDVGDTWPTQDDARAVVPVRGGITAAEALVEAVNDHRGEGGVHIVALGPLTNVATALQIDPGLAAKAGSLFRMGRTITGQGNCTAAAEYNWFYDPEAVDKVVSAGFHRMVIVPWETTADAPIPWDSIAEWQREASGPAAKFFQDMLVMLQSKAPPGDLGFCSSDALALCCCVHPPVMAASEDRNVAVECKGEHTRGACVVDRRSWSTAPKNATLVSQVEKGRFLEVMKAAFLAPYEEDRCL